MVCIEDGKATNAPIQVDLGNFQFCASEFQWVFCSSICKSGHWNKMRLISAKKDQATNDKEWGSFSCLFNCNIKHYFVRLLLTR